jgi:diguanylate cyclase (GGDEF)-like protein/PAS domain S-box-containing protein
MLSLQETRGLQIAHIQGDDQFADRIEQLQENNTDYIRQIDICFTQTWIDPKIILQYETDLKVDLHDDFFTHTYNDPELMFEVYTHTIQDIIQLINAISHFGAGLLNENKNNYYGRQLLYNIIPPILETHAKLRGIGTGVLTSKTMTALQEKKLILHRYHFVIQLQKMREFMHYYNLSTDGNGYRHEPSTVMPQSITLIDKLLADREFSISNDVYFKTFTKVSDHYSAYRKDVYTTLLTQLQEREQRQNRHLIYSYIGIFILIFCIFYMLIGVLISARTFTKGFLKVTREVTQGDLDQRLAADTCNEYGKIAKGLNTMINNLSQNAKMIDRYIDTSETDLDGKIISLSSAFVHNSGYTKQELIGQTHSLLQHPDMPSEIFEQMWRQISQQKTWEGEIKNRRKNGSDFWVETIIMPKYDEKGEHIGYLSIRQDITNQKHIEELSILDYLTQVYNRKYFNEKLTESIELYQRYTTPFSLIMIDVDYFKNINDDYGHLVGDECLIQLSSRLQEHLRANDILARWGGEEFIVLLPHSHKDEAKKIAHKLRSLIELHVFVDVSQITISLGVTAFLSDDSFDTVLERVDKALYMAKDQGRNRVVDL